MVFDPTTGNIWALNSFNSKISEITTSGALVRQCETPRDPKDHGIGAVTLVGSDLYIAESDPLAPGTIFVVNKASLVCDPPLPAAAVTTVLIEVVGELLADGTLNGGTAKALTTKLDTALRLLTDANERNDIAGMNALLAFVNQVQGLIARGILTPEEGQPMIDAALAAVNQILAGG